MTVTEKQTLTVLRAIKSVKKSYYLRVNALHRFLVPIKKPSVSSSSDHGVTAVASQTPTSPSPEYIPKCRNTV